MIDETLHVIARVGVLAGVFTSMLALGISVTGGQILTAMREARPLTLALLANFAAVPLFALLLVQALPLTPEGRAALLLLGALGGAPLLPKLAELAGEPPAFAVGLMVLLTIASVGVGPLVLPLLLPRASVPAGDIARSLVFLMLLPLALGLLGRARYAGLTGWSAALGHIAGAALAVGLAAGLLAGGRDLLSVLGSWIVLGGVLLALGAVAIGWLFAAGGTLQERSVAALGTGMRNFSAALLVAGLDFGGATQAMTMAATIALLLTLTIVAGELGRRRKAGGGRRE